MKFKASEWLTIVLWIGLLSLGVVSLAVVTLIPEKALYFIDLDREVRYLRPAYVTIARILIGLVVVGQLVATAFIVNKWDRARRAKALRYGASADEFFESVNTDFRNWTRTSDYRAHLIALIVLIGLGVVFRFFQFLLPVGYDESISVVWFSSRSWLDVISDYPIPNNHIFYNFLVNLLVKTVGITPLAVRLPALLAGILVIPCSYWLVRRLFNERAALMMAGLSAAAPLVIEYSTQGRGYTLVWLLFLLTFIVATYLKERSSLFGWGLFVMLATLGMYTVPVMLFGVCVIGFWMLLTSPRPRQARLILHLAAAGMCFAVATLLVYSPTIWRTDSNSVNQYEIGEAFTYPSIVLGWVADLPLLVTGLFILGLFYALIQQGPGRRQGNYLLLASLLSHVVAALMGWYPPKRVLNYHFFAVGSVASFGLAQLYARIPRMNGGMATFAWVGLVIGLSAYWGTVRLINTRPVTDSNGVVWVRDKAPGAEGITCCGPGYYVDAKGIVTDWSPRLQPGDAIVAHEFSGAVATMRFYVMEARRTPVLIHPYRPRKGLKQLAPYDQTYIVIRDSPPASRTDAHAEPNPGEVIDMLAVSPSELDRDYYPAELVATYRISRVYRLQRRVPLVRDPSKPVKVPFNMFWYW